MPTLKQSTAASAIRLLHVNLDDLRSYALDFDPHQIDRLIKSADLISGQLKKLFEYVVETDANNAPKQPPGTIIDISAVSRFLDSVQGNHICGRCGGLIADPSTFGVHSQPDTDNDV